jgi:hypothetical protein
VAFWVVLAAGVLGAPELAESAKPAKPEALRGQEKAGGVVELSWRDRSNNEVTFQIQRKTGNGFFVTIANPPANSTEHDDVIVPGTRQVYRIRARNGDGPSGWSNSCFVNGNPSKPGALTAQRTPDGVQLAWKDAGNNERRFEVQRRLNPSGVWTTIATLPADTEEYLDETADAATAYGYRVRAKGNPAECTKNSAWSRTASVTGGGSPLCPTNGPLQNLQNNCSARRYNYSRSGEQASLRSDGQEVVVRGQLAEEIFGVTTVHLFGHPTSSTRVTFDLACAPEFDVCIVLPIDKDFICTPEFVCVPNDSGISGDVLGELRDAGQTLRLAIVGEIVDDFAFVNSVPAQ